MSKSTLTPTPAFLKEGDKRIGQRYIKEDGARQGVPHLPYEKWIDASGNVVNLVVHSTRNLKDVPLNSGRYGSWVRSVKAREGWLPYDEPAPGYTPERWVNGGREAVIAERVKKHQEADAQFKNGMELMKDADAIRTQKAFENALDNHDQKKAGGFAAAVEAKIAGKGKANG